MKKLLLFTALFLLTGYGMAQDTTILPGFTTQSNRVCNKTEIAFMNTSTVFPVPDHRNTLLQLRYEWGDGDTTTVYAKSQEHLVTKHSYDLPPNETIPYISERTVYIKLTVAIVDTATMLPTGSEVEYVDSLIVIRPLAAFTDDGHLFPCPDDANGVKGRTIRFINQSQGSVDVAMWDFGDTASGLRNRVLTLLYEDTTSVHTYMNAGVYSVLLIIQDANRCVDSVLKKDHVVILGPRGSVTHTEDPSNCKPLLVTFYPSVDKDLEYQPDSVVIHTGTERIVNRGDYYALERIRRAVYQWSGGAYLPVYSLYKTVEFEGKNELCVVRTTAEDTIYVIDLNPHFETDPLYCVETPVKFNNTSSLIPSHLNDSVTVTWDMGNGDTSSNYHGETVYHTAGTYTVKMTIEVSRCHHVYYDTITVLPYAPPIAAFEADPMVGYMDQEFTFTDKSIKGDGDIIRWFWDYGDGIQSSDSLNSVQKHVYSSTSENRSVTLLIKDENGCWDTANVHITVNENVGLPNLPATGDDCPYACRCNLIPVSIFPNPARNNINIILPNHTPQAFFTLYDMQGKVYIKEELSRQSTTLSTSNLATGIYIYNITTEKQNCMGKIIIDNE